ncbi:hydrogenase maturation nickel metallochaperone HypA/HybF [Trichlorobacter lovleyi]|uniref:Hydrogenase maturation factor HypA n=1 Tax=Trichlorobacter lovleyi (strain ATCC BAA-1151 / DSM 17278 / SZ) TaxID=398767 RepID=B3E261_TRIL1|nr:hydrogenase maturation nickel metallochaperone HypA [Trichlorobacter lovleyi]ACD97164.1 hydrogenase expression/synthesis HypA [Trichlorobacter lovleyi SZ]
MHEMALTQGIVDICLQHAGGQRISTVVIEIGTLSGVVPEAVEFCFSACSTETLAASARLEIRRIEAQGRCLDCSGVQPVERLYDPCRQCGSYALELLSGEEMRVVEIEVDD